MAKKRPWAVQGDHSNNPVDGVARAPDDGPELQFFDNPLRLPRGMRQKIVIDPKTGKQSVAQYTTDEAGGAWPNETRVRKVNSREGDTFKDGAEGVVIGSLGLVEPIPTPQGPAKYGYFIEWDACPGIPIFTVESKLEVVDE